MMQKYLSQFYNFRLGKAYEELNEYLKNEDELKECEQFAAARNILEEAKLQLA